jgi:hypothetical protein
MKYWENVSECVCNSSSPIGSCLKCDMKDVIALISRLKQECDEAISQLRVGAYDRWLMENEHV